MENDTIQNSIINQIEKRKEMGLVKSLIDGLDNTKELEQAAKQAINTGLQLIDKRFTLFENQMNLPIGQITKMPSKYLIMYHKKKAVSINQNASNVDSEIKSIVESFCKGDIAKGIQNVFKSSLDVILGSYSGGYNQSQDYVVVTNQMGGLFRIDYLLVQQKIEAKALTKHVTDIFGSYLIVSSVAVQKITDDNVYKVIVNRQFPDAKMRQKLLLVRLIKGEKLAPDEMQAIDKVHAKTNHIKLISQLPGFQKEKLRLEQGE